MSLFQHYIDLLQRGENRQKQDLLTKEAELEREWFERYAELPISVAARKELFRGLVSMDFTLDELHDFNVFDQLIRNLRSVASVQECPRNLRVICVVADLLEEISKKGYRPPQKSVWKRLFTHTQVRMIWRSEKRLARLNRSPRRGEKLFKGFWEFAEVIGERFGTSPGNVNKIIYRQPTRRRYTNLRKKVE